MIHRFARPVPEISMITNTVMDHIFLSHGHRISQWNFDILSPPMLQEYADVIHAKGSLRTADVFPVVASLPPIFGGREATTGNTSAVRRLCKRCTPQPLLLVH